LFVLIVLAQQGHASVWIAVGWFAAALLFYRFVRAPQVEARRQRKAKRAVNRSP
jgi:hypothetical protein